MPEVTQVEMTEYLRTNLPFIMMTMEDSQGRNLWDKHGRMDLRTGVFWNIGKLPEDVLKQVWDYTYTLFMQEKESPGFLKYQADLGRIRYELEKVGWRWGGSQCSQGVCHETFQKGTDNQLLKLQYGHQDDVMGEAGARPSAGDMNYMSHYPLNEIVPALMKAQWVYQGHVYSQGVYYANLALTPFMIHLEVGGESQGNPGPEQPQLSPGTKNEIAHEQREEAGGVFDLYVHADHTWKLSTPEGWAEGKYDQEGHSYEAMHQHPIIRDWINEQGEILFGKVPSWQIDTELERKAQQNWDVLPTTSRLQYLTTYVKPSVPSAENFSQSSWASLPNNIKDIIRHAYAGEQAGNRYVVEADITHTSRHTFYVLAGNEAEAKQKVKGGDTTHVEDHDQYIISPLPDSAYNFKVVRPARPDEGQYYH